MFVRLATVAGGFALLALTLRAPSLEGAVNWRTHIPTLKRSVVNIKNSVLISLESEKRGVSNGTGFVVDADRGIIATNQHVIGLGPSNNEVTFYNGSVVDGQIIYADDIHDYAFLKIDPSALPFKLEAVTLGSAFSLKSGDPLLLIGNNQVEEYSIKTGEVSNLFVNKGYLYANYVHSSFDRAGGSSGSPVWNEKHEVVGMHTAGNDTSSFELYIDYLTHSLKRLQSGKSVPRGYLGLDINLISLGEAQRYYGFPKELAAKLQFARDPSPNKRLVRKLPLIVYLIPRTSGHTALSVGDILWEVDGTSITDNLFALDRILDKRVGKIVTVVIYRNGKKLVRKIRVDDLTKTRINEFVRFSGAVFHKITPFLRRDFGFDADGIYLHYAEAGSGFSDVATKDKRGYSHAVIQHVAGHPVRNLEEFFDVLKGLQKTTYTHLVLRDFQEYNSNVTVEKLRLDSKLGPLELFRRNPRTLAWQRVR